MFIESELESSGVGEENGKQDGESKGRLASNLQSIITRCETLEMELAREKARGLVPEEMDDGLKRVGAVRAVAESML